MSRYEAENITENVSMRNFTVGQLAEVTGLSKVTIRYYERCQLLPKAARQASGYRMYPGSILSRIRFIKNAKLVGFTLPEIKKLLTLLAQEKTTSQQIKHNTQQKLNELEEKIIAMQHMAHALRMLIERCDGKKPLHACPILEAMYGESETLFSSPVGHSKPRKDHNKVYAK